MRFAKHLILLFGLTVTASSQTTAPQILGPYSVISNFAADMAGTQDSRPGMWGSSGAVQIPIQFSAPTGYRVRILRVTGDFIATPKTGVIQPGTYAEVGWGLKTTAPDGSATVTYPGAPGTSAYVNSFVWVQNFVTVQTVSSRVSFDYEIKVGGLLEADNIMICQPFVALNTSGLVIHMEPTFRVVFQFESQTAQ